MTMLEKMASAMLVPAQQSRGWHIDASRGLGAVEIDGTIDLIALARAALEAIREPSDGVMAAYFDRCHAGGDLVGDDSGNHPAYGAFTAMIDAILAGEA